MIKCCNIPTSYNVTHARDVLFSRYFIFRKHNLIARVWYNVSSSLDRIDQI